MNPYISFLKLLAKKPQDHDSLANRLQVWIPDTVVICDGKLPPM